MNKFAMMGRVFLAWMYITAFVAPFCCSAAGGAEAASTLFPFVVPVDDVSGGVTDMSFLNDRPADQPVTVRDGRFYAGEQRIRFWGMNTSFESNYPTHEQATVMAKRFAKLGMNMVRITHTDRLYAPRGLFNRAFPGEMRIDPERMERLDYFIAQLKEHGIYVELSLHVNHLRMMGKKRIPELGPRRYGFGSGMPLWNERFIEAEKQYARDFFGHVNKYTGKPYTEEPAVAMLEIMNENGILCAWPRGAMKRTWSHALVADLQDAWNAHLKQRYRTTDALRRAWAGGEKPGDRRQVLRNPDFAQGMAAWVLQTVAPSTATAEVSKDGYQGRPGLLVTCDPRSDQSWHINLQQTAIAIEKDAVYRLSFAAKADRPAALSMALTKGYSPHDDLGLVLHANLTGDWQRFSECFVARESESRSRLMVRMGQAKNRLHFADFSLEKIGITGLPPGETLEASNVTMPLTPADCLGRTPQVARDFVDFLYQIDERYFTTMYQFLRDELGARQPIKGTQANSDYSSFFSQEQLDFIDVHGYWQHPHNPQDRRGWTFRNIPMVNATGSTAVNLAFCRVKGKPFHVSEYGHPAPNTYCSEQIPTISAFAALQDWDGIVLFNFSSDGYTDPAMITGWFEHKNHSPKLVTMPFGALAFRRGDVAPAIGALSVGLALDELKHSTLENVKRESLAANKGPTWFHAFTRRVSLTLDSETTAAFSPVGQPVAISDTGELTYDMTKPDAGVLVINSPRSKAVVGFGAGRTFDLGEVCIRPGPTIQDGFSVITVSVVSGNDCRSAGARLLFTATGYVENANMGWNAEKTSVGDQWGRAPVLCEGIPLEVVLKTSRASAWALDPRGQRTEAIAPEKTAGGISLRFGPRYRTLWYEVVVQ